ncbi:hypothetical protein [Tenacibaculum sp. 190130A14a]
MKNVDFFKDMKAHFQSKSGSYYYYTEEGVFRYSNHWGRVANCRWKIKGIEGYKNQKYYVGFAKWSDFYPLNNTDKVFYVIVDFKNEQAKICRVQSGVTKEFFLMTSEIAHQKLKSVQTVFKDTKWMKYLNGELQEIQQKVIHELINGPKSLQEIKVAVRHEL